MTGQKPVQDRAQKPYAWHRRQAEEPAGDACAFQDAQYGTISDQDGVRFQNDDSGFNQPGIDLLSGHQRTCLAGGVEENRFSAPSFGPFSRGHAKAASIIINDCQYVHGTKRNTFLLKLFRLRYYFLLKKYGF